MKPLKALLVAATMGQIACIPPVYFFLPDQPRPFHGMPGNDPTAASQLAKESRRTLALEGPDSLSRVIDALINMGCTISASDPVNGYVTFERSQKEPEVPRIHKNLGYDSAMTAGTVKLSPAADGVVGTLVLTGKIHWRAPHHAINTEVFPRLSPEDHKRFFDELQATIQTPNRST